MTPVTIRAAATGDLAQVSAIYGHYVLGSVATFEFEPPDLDEMTRRHAAAIRHRYPYLIAACGAAILGYAYAGPYRARPAYQRTVENSVYLAPDATGRGIGTQLLTHLIHDCVDRGFRQMVAIVGGGLENVASVRLHARCGFNHIGVLTGVGYKFDRWIDTLLMQRQL